MCLREKLETKIPPPVYGLSTGFIMWLSDQLLPTLSISNPVIETIGITLIIAGAGIDLTALTQFFQRRTSPNPFTPEKATTLVATGLYRYSRNPMYLGLFLLLAGWALLLANLISIAYLALFVWIMNQMQIIPEERILTKKFGESYLRYRAQVRRWI